MQTLENRRLLIVDDEKEIRNGYRKILSQDIIPKLVSSRVSPVADPLQNPSIDFEILEAESGDQALEIFIQELNQGRRFAGAFVDVRMPGKINGLQFIQEAWRHDPDLMVSVVTAYQDRSVNEIARMFGSPFQDQWDYLNKPFSPGEIIQKARQLTSAWNRRAREKAYLQQIKEQQEALIAQERLAAVGRLARSVGHEFGNILQSLLTQLDISHEQATAGDFDRIQENLSEMIESVTLGASICQDLLTFSRETHQTFPSTTIQLTPTSLELVVKKALRLLRHELKKRDIQPKINIPPQLEVQIEEPRILQVFVNLFKNSLDALKDGGKLEVSAQYEAGQIQIQILDDGIGISPLNLPHVFEPLFTTKGKFGNGLGLAACKQILESHGGRISIQSQEKVGTSVSLNLPIQSQK